jgi:hypothetical protein
VKVGLLASCLLGARLVDIQAHEALRLPRIRDRHGLVGPKLEQNFRRITPGCVAGSLASAMSAGTG